MPQVPRATTQTEVDKRIEMWHAMPEEEYELLGSPGLDHYLGWTREEYGDWVTGLGHPHDWEET